MPSVVIAIETANPPATTGFLENPRAAGQVAACFAEPLGTGDRWEAVGPVATEQVTVERAESGGVMPAVQRLLAGMGAAPKDVGRVGVSVGPGGFTAVRTAAVTAQAMAEAGGVQAVALPTAAVAAWAEKNQTQSRTVAVLLAGKRQTAWAAVVGHLEDDQHAARAAVARGAPAWLGAEIDADGLAAIHAAHGFSAAVVAPHTPAPILACAQRLGLRVLQMRLSAHAAMELTLAGATSASQDVAPIYPREPEAVTNWRRLGRPL